MNYDKLIKLEQLIKSSTILDATEREEWLALLDLMNDKQLLELEKILQVPLKPKGQPVLEIKQEPVLEKAVKKEDKPVTLAEVLAKSSEPKKDPSPLKAAEPKLGHLMNLPASFSAGQKHNPVGVSPSSLLRNFQHTEQLKPAMVGIQPKKPEPSKGAFWKKVKDILSEKELTAGHESLFTEKELSPGLTNTQKPESSSGVAKTESGKALNMVNKVSEPVNKPQPAPAMAKVTVNPLPHFPSVKKIGIDIPVPAPKLRPQPISLKLIMKQEVSEKAPPTTPAIPARKITEPSLLPRESVTQHLEPKELFTQSGFKDVRKIETLKQRQDLGKEENKLATGIKLDEVHAKADSSKVFSSLKSPIVERKAKLSPQAFQKSGLTSLDDLKKLTLENFVFEDQNSIIKNIKDFIRNFGYHEVLFSLEQSPLFKSYINTGATILSGKAQFSLTDNALAGPGLLKQEDFEKIADLLMEIQTG